MSLFRVGAARSRAAAAASVPRAPHARLLSSAEPALPDCPNFSSGPTAKRPGWSLDALSGAWLGRSHRAAGPKARLKEVIDLTHAMLELPDDYLVGIVPASDTGAYEMAMWSMLGPRPVDMFYWESFGKGWVTDASAQLKLPDQTHHEAEYGALPDLSRADPRHDVCFTWNGTTSGVRVPDADFIAADREGLTLCDATSAVFAMDMDWSKLDVTTFSWQKVLGGEGAHGVLVLSPRAVERLESFEPQGRPLPKIFRMTKKGELDAGIFKGSTINTPSMLCVEDCLDALRWVERIGGLAATRARSDANLAAVEEFVDRTPWIDFLARDPATRSNTSVCLTLDADPDDVKAMCALLDEKGAAHDIGSYRDAPPGLRIWCGATVETADVRALMPWIEWGYEQCCRK
jgi:phosphoserine aminotransferase